MTEKSCHEIDADPEREQNCPLENCQKIIFSQILTGRQSADFQGTSLGVVGEC